MEGNLCYPTNIFPLKGRELRTDKILAEVGVLSFLGKERIGEGKREVGGVTLVSMICLVCASDLKVNWLVFVWYWVIELGRLSL